MTPELGRQLWHELHSYALNYPVVPTPRDRIAAQIWLGRFLQRVVTAERASPGCHCARHWQQILKRLPPNVSGRAAFGNWAVAAHNEVNHRLGKPFYETARH